jgi:type II secretory pathway component GspD/PulD (secretin)
MKKYIVLFFIVIVFFYSAFSEEYFVSAFQTDIREVLSTLSYDSGIPIIMDPNISGVLTLEIVSDDFEEVMDLVLMPFGYAWKRYEDYILVGIPDHASDTAVYLNENYMVKMRNLNANDIVSLLPDYYSNFVTFNENINDFITIIAPPRLAGKIAELIMKIDSQYYNLTYTIKAIQLDKQTFSKWFVNEFQFAEVTPQDGASGISIVDNIFQIVENFGTQRLNLVLDKAIENNVGEIVANVSLTTMLGNNSTVSGRLTDTVSESDEETEYMGFVLSLTPYNLINDIVKTGVTIELKDLREVNDLNMYLVGNMQSVVDLRLYEENYVASFDYSSFQSKDVGIPLISRIPGLGSVFSRKIQQEKEHKIIFLIECSEIRGENFE